MDLEYRTSLALLTAIKAKPADPPLSRADSRDDFFRRRVRMRVRVSGWVVVDRCVI